MTLTRIGTVIVTVAGLAGVAGAQPTPADPEAEQPTEEAAPEPAPEPEPAPVEATTTAVVEPAPVAEPAASTAEVGYDKGFVIAQENDAGTFEMKVQGRVQVGFNSTSIHNDTTDERDNTAAFQVTRARLVLEGHMFTKKLGYKFQTDFGKGFVALRDFYIDGEVATDTFIRAGQWKRPFSRQQINSSGKLEMIDRAITDAAFRNGRDIGVAVHNNYEKSPDLEWAAGLFNGIGDAAKPVFEGDVVVDPTTGEGEVDGGKFTNVPKKFAPAFVARVGINHGGIKGYSEADLEGGPLRYAAAASIWAEGDFDDDGKMTQSAQADVLVKTEGLSASAAFYYALLQDDALTEDSNLMGFHVQAGKVLGEGTSRMQPTARYAMVKPKGVDAIQDIAVGFGFWPYGHNFKILVNVGAKMQGDAVGFGDSLYGQLELAAGFF